jgi:hypothetical protein
MLHLPNARETVVYDRAYSGESIRPADSVVFDRISSESDIFHKKPIGSDRVFVGFQSVGFRRNSTEPDEIRVGSGRISIVFRRIPTKTLSDSMEIISMRRDPITPRSHGYLV